MLSLPGPRSQVPGQNISLLLGWWLAGGGLSTADGDMMVVRPPPGPASAVEGGGGNIRYHDHSQSQSHSITNTPMDNFIIYYINISIEFLPTSIYYQ